jgi:ribulose-phosphate 3-epimerase
MIEDPGRWLEAFAEAGATGLTVHQETCPHLHRTVQRIRELGLRPGVAVNPATPIEALTDIAADVDLVLVMTVNPGFGGQSFIPASLGRLRRARALLDALGSAAWLEVDGGVEPSNAGPLVEAGVTALVAGSSVYRNPNGPARALEELRAAVRAAGSRPI